ncbi:MAG TPA: carbohydrate binding domain-containing protein, partial [Candidatus Eisenbacteria bacterium]
FLYNTRGAQYGLTNDAFANVNIAKRDANGNFVVAEGLAGLFYDAIVSKNIWDGLFIDTYCSSVLWSQTPLDSIDYVRAGYPTIQAFDAAWSAATDTLASQLRQLAGSSEILVGNCIPGTKYAWFNGWMAENFPYQNGGTWDENMYRNPGGYFADERGYIPPRYNHLFSAASDLTNPYTPDNMRKVRFGLGSASLGDGFGVFGYASRNTAIVPYHLWWYDEYAVDRATGRSTTSLQNTGWLGPALAPYSQVIWVSSAPDAIGNPGFEADLSGWTFGSTYPGSFTRDASTAAVGSASGHVHLSQVDVVPWGAGIQYTNHMMLTAGLYYSATFWAKASTPRRITVDASAPGGGGLAHGFAFLTTTWKQFQVVFRPTASGSSNLQFQLGADAGDVWVDDVHFQTGTSSIYRRDFKYGIVLVNPTALSLEVPLERSFYRIRGLADPVTNNGVSGRQFTVPPNDALFLLGADQVKPAAVLDFHIAR